MLEELRKAVYEANLELPRRGLVTYTWGNVSGIDRGKGLMVIKPSGVEYSALRPEDLVVLDMNGLTGAEVEEDYEKNTGTVIVETFRARDIDPVHVPGVICRSHGPFAWGKDAAQAVYHAAVLEEVAKMALLTVQIDPGAAPAPQYVQDKHFLRKHGPGAYYGQARG